MNCHCETVTGKPCEHMTDGEPFAVCPADGCTQSADSHTPNDQWCNARVGNEFAHSLVLVIRSNPELFTDCLGFVSVSLLDAGYPETGITGSETHWNRVAGNAVADWLRHLVTDGAPFVPSAESVWPVLARLNDSRAWELIGQAVREALPS